jgi:hypothetical protein
MSTAKTVQEVAAEMKGMMQRGEVNFTYLYHTQYHVLQAKHWPEAEHSVISSAISSIMNDPTIIKYGEAKRSTPTP